MNSKIICIAGFNIRLQSEKADNIALEESFLPFVLTNDSKSIDLLINTINGIPPELMNDENLLFEAKDQQQKYFSIYQHEQSYKFIVYNQRADNEIQQIALLNKNFSEWIIYKNSHEENNVVYPLSYPMGPLVFYYLTVKYNAIMIHASGVFDGEKGRIFTGFSGAGKTTMAYLWQKSGNRIINDDRLIIRKENADYFMYNTPMFYTDISKKTLLNSINLIYHAPDNIVARLNGAKAVSRIMAFCIQHGYNNRFIEHHLEFLSELCSYLPVYEVGFLPDEKIVNYIKTYAV